MKVFEYADGYDTLLVELVTPHEVNYVIEQGSDGVGWIQSILKSNTIHLPKNAVHSIFNGLEPENSTTLALKVPTQNTKSCKPGPTGGAWTDVDFVLMDRAFEMLIQRF